MNIYSSVGTDGLGESYYGWMDGTSMATPHVTGAVTLLASGARNATAGEIIASLIPPIRFITMGLRSFLGR